MLTNIVSDSALVFLGRARLGVVTSGNKQLGPYNRQTEDRVGSFHRTIYRSVVTNGVIMF